MSHSILAPMEKKNRHSLQMILNDCRRRRCCRLHFCLIYESIVFCFLFCSPDIDTTIDHDSTSANVTHNWFEIVCIDC